MLRDWKYLATLLLSMESLKGVRSPDAQTSSLAGLPPLSMLLVSVAIACTRPIGPERLLGTPHPQRRRHGSRYLLRTQGRRGVDHRHTSRRGPNGTPIGGTFKDGKLQF